MVVSSTQPKVPIDVWGRSIGERSGPYPIPPNAPIESVNVSGSDRHVLVVQSGSCVLYEMFDAYLTGAPDSLLERR